MKKPLLLSIGMAPSIARIALSGVHMRSLLGLALSLCLAPPAVGEDANVIASFGKPDSVRNWVSVNDGVMGGVSEGRFERTERNTLLFTGTLSLENNGGFASIRTRPGALNLAGASGIVVKARGDGRTYWVDLRTARQFGASSYRTFLPTSKGAYEETRIPFSAFELQTFGRRVPAGAVDPAAVVAVGFTLADKKPGPFALEIEYMKTFSEDAKSRQGDPGGTIAELAASSGSIRSIDPAPVPPEASAQSLTPALLIELAINRGVPLFNNGDPGACAAVYEVTCEALRIMPGVSEDSRADLARALANMRDARTEREKAWILRYALDRVLSRQREGD